MLGQLERRMEEVAVRKMEASRSRWGAEVVRRAEEVAVGLIEASRARWGSLTELENGSQEDGGIEVTVGQINGTEA